MAQSLSKKANNINLKIDGTYNEKSSSSSTVSAAESSNSTLRILTNADSPIITVGSGIRNIDSSNRMRNTQITGNSLANSIRGGRFSDTINSGKGNDTLTGGLGTDVFIYENGGGNDVITDYISGQDKIKITGAKISKTSVIDKDVILTVGSGSIKVKNGKGKTLSIYNNSTSETNTVISDSSSSSLTTVTLNNSTSSPYTAASGVKTINASSRTTAIRIKGNSLANSIVGGSGADSLSGGSGADTLNGGKGNDTLTGGAGNDVFFYQSGQGTDIITDYSSGDKIKISGAKISSTSVSGSDVVLKVGSGSVRVKSGAGKTLSIYNNSSSATSTIIGNSSSNYEERWFLDNAECEIRNSELDSIMNTDSSVISNDYNYETDSNYMNKQINQTLVTNSIKQSK